MIATADNTAATAVNADATEGWNKTGDTWTYVKDGKQVTGWVQDDNKWYYLDNSGAMKTGWVQSGDKWYYLNNDGSMAVNTTVNGYTVGEDGALV